MNKLVITVLLALVLSLFNVTCYHSMPVRPKVTKFEVKDLEKNPTVYMLKPAKKIPDKVSPPMKKINPQPLSIEQIKNASRQALNIAEKYEEHFPYDPPAVITLSPLVPKSGDNFLVSTKPIYWSAREGIIYFDSISSEIDFFLLTIPNRTYLMDIIAYPTEGPAFFRFTGDFLGDIWPEYDHVMIAFTATSTDTRIFMELKNYYENSDYVFKGCFHACTITRLD